MAKINLLPWREARREQLKQEFLGNLGSVVIGAGLLIGVAYFFMSSAIEAQHSRNAYMQKNIDSLNEEVQEIDTSILFNTENTEIIENTMEKIRLPPFFPKPGIHAL